MVNHPLNLRVIEPVKVWMEQRLTFFVDPETRGGLNWGRAKTIEDLRSRHGVPDDADIQVRRAARDLHLATAARGARVACRHRELSVGPWPPPAGRFPVSNMKRWAWVAARRRGLIGASLITLTLLYGLLIIRNETGQTSAAVLRQALNDHRLAVDGAWFDIGNSRSSDEFYSRFGELAAADVTLAETLRRIPGTDALRASLLRSIALETAIAGTHGSGLPDYLAKLFRETAVQSSLESAIAARLHVPVIT